MIKKLQIITLVGFFLNKQVMSMRFFNKSKNFKKGSFILIKIYPRFKRIKSIFFRKAQSALHLKALKRGNYFKKTCHRYSKKTIWLKRSFWKNFFIKKKPKAKAKYLENLLLKSTIWLKKDFLVGVVIWRVLVSPEIKSLVELVFQAFFY